MCSVESKDESGVVRMFLVIKRQVNTDGKEGGVGRMYREGYSNFCLNLYYKWCKRCSIRYSKRGYCPLFGWSSKRSP